MRHRYLLADVFTDRLFGGNPLAVFPQAAAIDPALMQSIARELNLSETVFVLPPDDPRHTFRLRIFTPAAELPFAGHPTVGAAYLLAASGFIKLGGDETRIVFEEGVGAVPVTIRARNNQAVFAQFTTAQLPEFGAAPAIEVLAPLLGLHKDDLLAGEFAPQVASCGLPFLLVPLRDADTLARARAEPGRWAAALAGCTAQQIYLFTPSGFTPPGLAASSGDGIDLRARMFAPTLGVAEDPATGSAAAALAGYLASRAAGSGTLRWRIAQGIEMGRPSRIDIEADIHSNGDASAITAVRVGGASLWIGEGALELPAA